MYGSRHSRKLAFEKKRKGKINCMDIERMINFIKRFLTKKDYRFAFLAGYGFYKNIPDDIYLMRMYHGILGYELNLDHPQKFNEKMQWLKLYDRNENYVTMVDKFSVKEYVENKIGIEYIIPTIGVWKSADEIKLDELPNQFVLKVTHDSGGLVICKNKKLLNWNKEKKKLNKSLKRDYYIFQREWPYKNVQRRIIAEKYLENDGEDLTDYKFMCFGGKVKCIFTCSDRFSKCGLKVTFYDLDWNILPFERHYPARKEPEKKPISLNLMIRLAETLAEGIPFVRIDFYEVDEKPYFGEITFFPGSGFEEFTPEEWDDKLGKWIRLPRK